MQVPEHLVSLYVATCGQSGVGLGSDEKEIILLVYVILEAATGKIVGVKQLLVRPDGTFVKDRTVSQSSDASTLAASPPLAIAYPEANNSSNSNNNNINSNTNSNSNNNISNINANNSSSSSINNNNSSLNPTTNCSTFSNVVSSNVNANNIASNQTVLNNNTNSNNNNNNNNSSNNSSSSNANSNSVSNSNSLVICSNNNNNNNNGPNSSAASVESINELPIAEALTNGKPLNEAIEEFDEYLRSLALSDFSDIRLITDGQLPLRQCLHREACAKDIELPIYYNRFCDLRKEFLKHKSGDLSRALVPLKDIKKMLQTPTIPGPQSITEMMNELNIPSTEDIEFYIRESHDMVSVIQTLLKAGHKFTANETINLVLEPGICSVDDEIDGNCIVRARGLPWQSSDQDIAKFFRGLNVAKGGVALCLSPLGRRNGEALIRFISQEHRDMALKRHKHHIGNRYIEVYRATGEDFLSIAGGASNEAQAFLSKGAQVIIRMRGLPYDCTAKQVLDFFTTGESPCNVLDSTEGVLFVKKPDGRATGDAFVLFANEADAPKALSRHRESIGQRYIELFRSTTAEVQQVLNRSMDPKTYEPNHQPPLIAQFPPMPLSLLPQHLITSGSTKNCIRLRGLPYEALVEHILHFLDDFAKHIIYQGVHMVINAQGQPSGEAFIQMDTEESARLCAQRKHNKFMVFGKKYRYIEVFQCSGDDMNMVLNGGLQSPVATHHPHHPSGKQPSLLSPGASVIGTPFGPFTHFGPPTPILASPHHRAPHHAPHAPHPATFYQPPFVYWSYPSPPVSPTTYYGQAAHSPTHVPGNLTATQHQPIYSLDFMSAVTSANFASTQQPPLSPPSVAIPPNTAGIIFSSGKTLVPPKQYSPLPATVVTPTNGPAHGGTYHGKLPLPAPTHAFTLQQQPQQNQQLLKSASQPSAQQTNSVYSPTETSSSQALLTVDVTHAVTLKPLPATSIPTTTTTVAPTAECATPVKSLTPVPPVASSGPSSALVMSAQQQCVELFIS